MGGAVKVVEKMNMQQAKVSCPKCDKLQIIVCPACGINLTKDSCNCEARVNAIISGILRIRDKSRYCTSKECTSSRFCPIDREHGLSSGEIMQVFRRHCQGRH